MDDNLRGKIFSKLVSQEDIGPVLREKRKEHIFETIPCVDDEHKERVRKEYEENNWEFDRYYSKSVKMKKRKEHYILFENKVWLLFSKLNFLWLNRGSDLMMPYDKASPPNTQQIDVFAKDDETVIYIECKSSQRKGTSSLKEVLEAWKTKKKGIEDSITKLFPGQTLKRKFILFTENLDLSDKDAERMKNIGGLHFDENKLDYYLKMFSQIGLATKFQLLADIFAGTEIPQMDNKIPAIQGKMGGHTYYSFSIEPQKLLKISYVLHRSKANENMMPTYQRIIKKRRLKDIKEFLDDADNPGYFPNSIIINIDTGGKKIKWDNASPQVPNAISKIGVLHLPKKYRSAFIIDGQHRLYGYSESRFRENNSIPVVAFVNLKRDEQVNLFMQINENQKAVPKTLRETLRSDLLWTSNDLREQIEALKSRVAITLGERNSAVFNDYMSIGEDNKVITPTSISTGLKKSNFLGKVDKDKIIELGSFYNGNLDDTLDRLYTFLNDSFKILTTKLSYDFSLGKESFLFVNKGITAIIMLLSDIVDHIESHYSLKYSKANKEQFMSLVQDCLAPVAEFVTGMDEDLRSRLKAEKGASAPSKYWRKFQSAVNERFSDFNPHGLKEYIENEEKALNDTTYALIRDIESYMQKDFKVKLVERFTDEWAWKSGVPDKVAIPAENKMRQKNKTRSKAEETDEWDNLDLINYREIADKNWAYMQENESGKKERVKFMFMLVHYTKPGEESLNKTDATKWIVKLNEIRKIVSHVSSDQVGEDEYNYVKSIHDWLVKKDVLNKYQKKELENS